MRQIIGLTKNSNGILTTCSAAFWFQVTSGLAPQASGSVWSGASAAENTAIQNGSVLEEVQGFNFPTGTSGANIKAAMLQYWTNRNAQINGVGPNQFYGLFYDSATGWSA